jgi:hypothetical protein
MGGRISLRLKYAIITMISLLIIGVMVFFFIRSTLNNFLVSSDLTRISREVQVEAEKTLDLEHLNLAYIGGLLPDGTPYAAGNLVFYASGTSSQPK